MKTQTEFAYDLARRLKTAEEMRLKHGLTMRAPEDIILIEVQAREIELTALHKKQVLEGANNWGTHVDDAMNEAVKHAANRIT